MKTFVCSALLVVSIVETAAAQIFCPQLPPPPQPVIWLPSAPLVVFHTLPAEDWRAVRYGDLHYCLKGQQYYVTAEGEHFRLTELSSDRVAHEFVEPFVTGTNCRAVRTLPSVPEGNITGMRQNGVKTIVEVDGVPHFATWVSYGDTITQVWCYRVIEGQATVVPRLQPQPDANFQGQPQGEGNWQPVLPRVQPEPAYEYAPPALPAPQLELPAPSEPMELIPQGTSNDEPEQVKPRPRVPVARA